MRRVQVNTAGRQRTHCSGSARSTGNCQVRGAPYSELNCLVLTIPQSSLGVPRFFRRCALTADLFDLIIELRPSTTAAGLSENIKRE